MKRVLNYFTVVLFLVYLSACDKIDIPLQTITTNTVSAGVKTKKVLLEDYTGHLCGNCPYAADTINYLKKTYGEKIVAVAIHVGSSLGPNAYPIPANGNGRPKDAPVGSYTVDFRTTTGDDYDMLFTMSSFGLPQGMINRKDYPNNHAKGISSWEASVYQNLVVDTLQKVNIEIDHSYNSSTRNLNLTIKSECLFPNTSNYKLVVLLTQNNIVDWQERYDANNKAYSISDYVFDHVLRDAINGTWGEAIAISTVGAVDTKVYEYQIKTDYKSVVCNPDECYVVAYIYDATTYEVIQAEEKKMTN